MKKFEPNDQIIFVEMGTKPKKWYPKLGTVRRSTKSFFAADSSRIYEVFTVGFSPEILKVPAWRVFERSGEIEVWADKSNHVLFMIKDTDTARNNKSIIEVIKMQTGEKFKYPWEVINNNFYQIL